MVEAEGKEGLLVGMNFRVARMVGAGEAGRWLPVYFRRARRMYPYIDIGAIHLGTFGLMLWLAAVAGTFVLH